MLKAQTRKIYIKILVFTSLIAISIFAIRPVHIALTSAMSHIRTNFIEKIESLTGIEIRYSSIRPNFFGSFDIRNLSLNKNNKPFLSVSRVRISFSLWELLKGKKAIFHSVRLEHPSITLDLQEDKDTFEFLSSLRNNENKTSKEVFDQVAQFFPGKTDMRIKDCFIAITDRERKYQIQNMNIDITGDGKMLSFNGDLNAEFIYSGFFNRIYSLNGDIHTSGVCSADFNEGSAKLDFSLISGSEQEIVNKKASFFKPFAKENKNTKEYFTVQPLNFTLEYKDGIFTLNIGDNLPFGGFIYYNTASKGIATEVKCDNFLLKDFVKFSNKNNDLNRIFFMPVTGEASFYSAGSAMRYRAEFQGADAKNNSFEFKTHGNDKYITFEKIRLSAPYKKNADNFFSGELDITGRIDFNPLVSSGSIAFNKFSLGTDEYINAFLSVSTQKNEIHITGENIDAGQLTLDNFNIYITPSKNDLSVAVSVGAGEEKTIDMFAAFNYPQKDIGSMNLGSSNLEVSASINSFSVYDLMQIASPFSKKVVNPPIVKKYLTDSSITTEIFLTTDFNQIMYNVPKMVFTSQDVTGVFSFAGNDRMFTLSESVISKNDTDLIVSAQYNFANPADIGFVLNAKYQDLSWNVEGQLLDKSTLIIRDKNGLRAYGSASNQGGVSGYMEGVDFPFLVNNKTIYLNFYIALRYTSSDFWFIDITKFNAREINPSKGINYISFSGAVNNDGASFRNLLISDNIGDLAGALNFSWDTDFSYINFLINLTDGRENGENYSVEGVVNKNHFDVLADVTDMRLDRLLKADKNSMGIGPVYVSARAEIKGDSIKAFNAKCGVESLYIKNNDIKASGNVLFTNDEFNASDLKFEFKEVKLQMPEIQLNRAESYAKMNGEIQGIVMNKWLQSNFEMNANFQNINSWLEIADAVETINGSFKADKILFGLEDYNPFTFIFKKNKGDVLVTGGPKNMLRFEMNKDGNIFASMSSPFPIRSTIVGLYKDGYIDVHCNDIYMDLSGIWELAAEIPEFAITGGYVTGNVDIRGPILDPEFFGTARGTSFRFSVPNYIGQDIKPVPFNAVLEGSDIIFGPVPATIGSGGGTVSGWLRFEKWVPENVSIDVTVPRNTPVPYKFNIMGFNAKGDASGRLNITHENRTLEISGSLLANNTELGINFEELMQSGYETEKPVQEPPIIVNLTVTTGPVVEFIWPNTSSPVLRANPEIGTVMTVYVDTSTGQYTINSDISIRSGEMYYFDRNFYIRHGVLVFRENEQQFNPRITARAEIRERMDSGPVTVSMIVDNDSLLSFVPRFESTPSLTQLEIYSLLGHSMYLASGNENGDEAKRFLVSSTTDVLSKIFANSELGQITGLRRFERTIRSWLYLDMFSVRTKILQNAAASAVTSNSGQKKVEKNNNISNYFDNTTIYAGKYIGQDMFIQSMLRLRYDENSMTMGGLRIEPDIGIELNTPLFNIRWDFLPESYNPENWGIKDNSITLIWSKSF